MDANTVAQLGAAIVVAVFSSGGFVALLNYRGSRKALDTDNLHKVAGAAVLLVEPLAQENARLAARVVECDAMRHRYERAMATLRLHRIPMTEDTQ